MPPFSQSNPLSTVFSQNHHKFHKPSNHSSTNIVTIDVGGQIFQTTKQTLTLAGSNTLFSNLFNSYDQNNQIPFVHRDPDLFSILLSDLRTGNLPSKAKLFDIQDIIFEAQYYGIDHLLVQCQSNPSQFEAFNLEKLKILNLGGKDCITSFDSALQRKSTVLTRFAAIDSLLSLSSNVVAAGATNFSGLQIIDLDKGLLMQSLNWENMTKSSSTVQAIGKSPEFLFTSFESGRRNSNSIMVYDVADGFRTVSEIARNEILKINVI
ncbi:putative chromatin remodeling & transcription regulator BTB-POZ family [Helianthus annuus]|nr:putative chromatin remodeling & transcription regulator BTB-POZ family [Helianthus annuus]KAJ0952132.1 putative chromatin remodeling & transcription regulator BTB-POZ family [Helianthus annuus]